MANAFGGTVVQWPSSLNSLKRGVARTPTVRPLSDHVCGGGEQSQGVGRVHTVDEHHRTYRKRQMGVRYQECTGDVQGQTSGQ